MRSDSVSVNLWNLLRERGQESEGIRFLPSSKALSRTQLLAQAAAVARRLAQLGVTRGQPIALCVHDSATFLPVFWGCLAQGAIPAPLPQPDLHGGPDAESVRRVVSVGRFLGTAAACHGAAERAYLQERWGRACRVLDLDDLLVGSAMEGSSDAFEGQATSPEDVAILQFSSGSTGQPKGVELTHRAILANLAAMVQVEALTRRDRLLSWLPYYHDFGLFGCHLTALLAGAEELRLEPSAIGARPGLWFDAVSRETSCVSFSTPTALRILTQELRRRVRQGERPRLEGLRYLGIGAEMIPERVAATFLDVAIPCGFPPDALRFGFGLAENTLMVTEDEGEHAFARLDRAGLQQGVAREAGVGSEAVSFAVLGRPIPEVKVSVRDEADTPLPPERIGHVWVWSPSRMRGYRAAGMVASTTAQGWFDTGDLGFLDRHGKLVLTGRAKEIILREGRNLFPHDIEELALSVAGGSLRDCIACSDYDPVRGDEQLVLFVVIAAGRGDAWSSTWEARVRDAVQRVFGTDVAAMPRLRPTEIPRTSSGKIQRDVLVRRWQSSSASAGAPEPTEGGLVSTIRAVWAETLELELATVGLEDDFFALGGDSLRAIRVQASLEAHVGRKLPPRFLLRARTVAAQGRILEGNLREGRGVSTDVESLIARIVAWEVGAEAETLGAADRILDLAPDMAIASRIYAALAHVFERDRGELERFATIEALGRWLGRSLVEAEGGSFDLMPFQETLFFHRSGFVVGEPSSLSCYIVYRVRLRGAFDRVRFERALDDLVQHHAMLRAVIDTHDDRPRLRVLASVPKPVLEWDEVGDRRPLELEMQSWRADLDRYPLFRARAMPLGPKETYLLLHIDHMLIDGHGFLRLVIDLLRRYDALAESTPPIEPTPTPPFSAYVQLERLRRRTAEYAAHMEKHLRCFADAPPRFSLPMRGDPARLPQVHFETHRTRLPGALVGTLSEVSRRHPEVSLNALLLAAYFKVMRLWSNQADLVINVPIFNRDQHMPGVEHVVGSFIDIFPVRLRAEPSTSLFAMATEIEAFIRGLLEYPVSSIDLARRVTETARTAGSLSSVIFSNSIHLIDHRELQFRDLEIVGTPEVHTGAPGTYLDLVLFNLNDVFCLDWNYVEELFEPSFVETLATQYQTILERFAADVRFGRIDRDFDVRGVVPAPWHRAHAVLNATTIAFDERPIPAQLDDVIATRPDALALTFEGEALTYAVWSDRADRVAARLQRAGVRPGEFVGVMCGRSIDLLVAQLAVLRCGAAYVPIDPGYPSVRQALMLEDCGAKVLLTRSLHASGLGVETTKLGLEVLAVDRVVAESLDASPSDRVRVAVDPRAPMYMIYTSGSTGRPKGVVVTHRSFANFIHHVLRTFVRGATEVFALVTSPSFDMTLTSNWAPFLAGGTLHVLGEEDTRDVTALLQFLADRQVTLLNVTPSHLSLLAQALPLVTPRPALSDAMQILLGGEKVEPEPLEAWLASFPRHRFVNEYGPTEVTVASTFFPIELGADGRIPAPVPIGRPIANTRVYVLASDGTPCMPGVPGHLHLAGDGVAVGYWRQPERTAAVFKADPFHGVDARMYATGDLAKFLPDGNLVFLGRADTQVNLRGYRIELGEVEAAIRALPGVGEAAVEVVADASGLEQLIGFVIPMAGRTVDPAALRSELGRALPPYMVPTHLFDVAALPLAPTGKLDRKALRQLAATHESSARREIAAPPRSELERTIHGIWAEVLGRNDFGIDEDFWALGGDSLRVMRFVHRLRAVLGPAIGLAHVFAHRTVAALAASVPRDEDGSFLVLHRPATPRRRVVVLPFAGGHAAVFDRLAKAAAPADAEVWAARYPGHEGEGAPVDSIPALADWLSRDRSFAPCTFVGVSFGAYVAYELTRRFLAAGGDPEQVTLVLVSATPPGCRDRIMAVAQQPAAAVRAALATTAGHGLGMTESELQRYVHLLQVDTQAMLDYAFEPLPSAVRAIVVIGEAEDDPAISQEASAWDRYLPGATRVRLPGDHLSVATEGSDLARLLVADQGART